MTKSDKSYSELILLPTFKERIEYLMLYGYVGQDTFGHSRYLNQALYKSPEWKAFRNKVIIRDGGCDLAMPGREIILLDQKNNKFKTYERAIIHHINPITREDILNRSACLFDLNNVILVSKKTHDIIHYAFSLDGIDDTFAIREPNDTTLW